MSLCDEEDPTTIPRKAEGNYTITPKTMHKAARTSFDAVIPIFLNTLSMISVISRIHLNRLQSHTWQLILKIIEHSTTITILKD
jgi:hypothetical protein